MDEKPGRRYRKRSKYDPIVDRFLEGGSGIVLVEVEGKEANYVRTQLKKRIDARMLTDEIHVSVASGKVYLEKL
ncbi:MAG: hypothetical protein ABIJ47_04725 [Candidatus Bathyarchaeota archaeon]